MPGVADDVVVIGAGIGGLSAAISLAARGLRVTVLEQLDRPGGKMGVQREAGYRWDTGPSVITMRDVFETLFARAGRRLEDHLDLKPLDPVTRYFWRDGTQFDAVSDPVAMRMNIAALAPDDRDAYDRFMAYAERLFNTVREPFLYRRKPGLRDLMRLPVTDALRIDALRSMDRSVRSAFRSPRLVQLFDRFATYNGSSPYRVPATLNTIAHVELAGGAFYPRGGIYAIAEAFASVAMALGIEIRYNTPVRGIDVRNGRVTAVITDAGAQPADAVVCNADYTTVRQHLLPQPLRASRERMEPSCSGYVLMLGVRGDFPKLAHHNIVFSDDYPREFAEMFDQRVAIQDPTLYVCITSKTDAEHAPPGCENWFVLVNAPYLSGAWDWQAQGDAYAAQLKNLLYAHIGLQPEQIEVERRLSPADIQRMYGGNRGAIYGYSSNTRTAAFMRPGNRDPKLRGLYYASGSAHPGGGVPLVTLAGMAAADCVLEDQRS
jgi:diapolycopene oxygenase